MTARIGIAAATLVVCLWPLVTAAQPADELLRSLRKEVDALKEGQASMQRDLQEIKTLLRAREAPPSEPPQNVTLTLDGAPIKGDGKARLVLIEFTDYQCPFCARHVRETMPQLDAQYITPGKLRYAVRDFPLEALHAQAFKAAEATHCAGEQGRYWGMHDRLFANARALGAGDLPGHAQALGLDAARFQACLEAGTHAARIRRDLAEGAKAGVRGTPSFFLAVQEPDQPRVKVVKVLRGALPFAGFKAAIDEALAAAP
jgi:protein-disulfide isomerase